MQSYVHDLLQTFRVADALDIAIVTLVILGGLSWFRTREARTVGIVLLVLAFVYILARRFEMYLTTQFFQIGFVGAILAFVVIFQQDIRRGFEQFLALFQAHRAYEPDADEQFIELIVEAARWLTTRRVGALLVFPGKEPLDPHISGGVIVDGHVSLPLVCSIFHPTSPGHDGAVVIDRQRLARLGVHLPLSCNQLQLTGKGTRHAAALGLSECTDALVLVLSEERGTISSAHNGRLDQVEPLSIGELLRVWLKNRQVVHQPPAAFGMRKLGLPLTSFALACFLWFMFAYQSETVQRTIVVPIEYRNLSEGWMVDDPKATWAEVTLGGSEQAFKLLDSTNSAVSLDLGNIKNENTIAMETLPNLKNIPRDLKVEQIQPEEVIVRVRQKQASKIR